MPTYGWKGNLFKQHGYSIYRASKDLPANRRTIYRFIEGSFYVLGRHKRDTLCRKLGMKWPELKKIILDQAALKQKAA
jgi:hypothetical protein